MPRGVQFAHEGRADEPTVAGDVYPGSWLQFELSCVMSAGFGTGSLMHFAPPLTAVDGRNMPLPSFSPSAGALCDVITSSPMSTWIGAGDARQIGWTNAQIVRRLAPWPAAPTVFDFGCGLGRTAVGVLDQLGGAGRFIGVDIVPGMIDFCRQQITPVFPQAEFHCTNTPHEVYDNVKRNKTEGVSEDALFAQLHQAVDIGFAFSVFTHLHAEAAAGYFGKIAGMLKPAGRFVFTAFLLDEVSRASLAAGTAYGHSDHPPGPADEVYMPANNLDFIAFDAALMQRMLQGAGLMVESVAYGAWRAQPAGLGLAFMQDCLCVRRKPVLPPGFDPAVYVALNPDVAKHDTGPVRHYLDFGFDELRRWA